MARFIDLTGQRFGRLNSGKMTIEEALLTPIGYRYNKGK